LRIAFAPKAERDLETALDFIARRSPIDAADLFERVRALVQRLADREFEGPAQQLRTGEHVRSWPLPPYRIYYRRSEDLLEIVRVYHLARRPIVRR